MVWTEEVVDDTTGYLHIFILTIIIWDAELKQVSIFIKELPRPNIPLMLDKSFSLEYNYATGSLHISIKNPQTRKLFFMLAPKIFEKESLWLQAQTGQ